VLRLIAMVCVVSGCDVVWRLDPVPPPDAAPPCVASDDFTGTRLANEWSTFAPTQQFVIEQADELRLDLSAAVMSVPGEAGVRYGVAFDLHGGSIEIEVAQVINAHPNLENYMRVRAGTSNANNYSIRYGDGMIDFRTRVNTDEIHRVRAYNATQDRFWRISNGPQPGDISFATRGSPSEPWFIETTQPASVPLDDMQVMFVAGTYNAGAPAPGVVIYDNFAVCGARAL
jgi:hypothetical protein